MKKIILLLYRLVFLNRFMVNINYGIYFLVLRGIGILNYENKKISGEIFLLRKISKLKSKALIFDVGANEGEYSILCKEIMPKSELFSFEPHPLTYQRILSISKQYKFKVINAALDSKSGKAILFDYSFQNGTSHASLYNEVITEMHNSKSTSIETVTWSIDDFMSDNNISKIDLLKIDTEGNEYPVLLGAQNAIRNQAIDVIQFEFSELNIVSKKFMKDFYDFLPGYKFYRLLPNYLLPLGKYNSAKYEIYHFQNIVAISDKIKL